MPFYASMGRASLTSLSTNGSPYHYVSTDGNSVWKGPRKICCFCTLAIVLPSLLISVPLLMRFVFFGTSHHFLNPSDMKILDKRISTTWCQAETVKINTTFTAYVTQGEPSLVDLPYPLTLDRNLIIPDDHKEYWGFYLLKGSKFKIRTCSRWKGGTLLIVQGESHLEHCAYIGEADSAGDSDEISSSNSIEVINNEIMRTNNHRTHSQEELSLILTRIRQYVRSNPKNYGKLRRNLEDWLLISQEQEEGDVVNNILDKKPSTKLSNATADILKSILLDANELFKNVTEMENSADKNLTTVSNNSESSILTQALLSGAVETGTIRRRKREAEVRRKTESGENGAFEEEDNRPDESANDLLPTRIHPRMKYLASSTDKPRSVPTRAPPLWAKEHGHYTGVLNDTYDPNDGSDSESESSFSSSEEALQKCEGVLATFNIIPDDNCEGDRSYEDLEIHSAGSALRIPSSDLTNLVTLPYYAETVNVSGYYYFIFGSENEKRDNFIRAKFELEKFEYLLPEPLENCTDVKECHVDFNFASSQKVVVRIPKPLPHIGDPWEQVYVAETECHPRTHLYMIFALMVPLVILLCAFQ